MQAGGAAFVQLAARRAPRLHVYAGLWGRVLPSLLPRAAHRLLPELCSLLAAGRGRLVDVRSRGEAVAGTIPGALSIPAFELESALQAAPAASPGSALAPKPRLEDRQSVFFCQMGGQGLRATQLAQGRPVDAEGMGKVAAG
ncbi:PREDICTED: thiosulfate sulfurtransferase/rhodanese-like domain-containing protein 1 [Hipposideros armiger]|uniref:Thiosulfate sulfurtransferase/rhodanese-like domain-containing protein 1 n=1 Tax=Hipposideros armiger TaxID=186990 RepID=A0A8B7QLQ9_HIPAR|nr:PREDICTED: thiosulfate sulfurtransferase/rhodanese-like domain-containing protein 1 [Hipposideros armiger]